MRLTTGSTTGSTSGSATGLANEVAFASAPVMPEIRAAGSARVPSVPRVPDIRAGSQVYEGSPSEADMGSPLATSAPISQHMQQGYVAGHVSENRAAIRVVASTMARRPAAPSVPSVPRVSDIQTGVLACWRGPCPRPVGTATDRSAYTDEKNCHIVM